MTTRVTTQPIHALPASTTAAAPAKPVSSMDKSMAQLDTTIAGLQPQFGPAKTGGVSDAFGSVHATPAPTTHAPAIPSFGSESPAIKGLAGGVIGNRAQVAGQPVVAHQPAVAHQPVVAQPVFTAPTFTPPVFTAPTFTAPVYTPPAYTPPVFTAPVYTPPVAEPSNPGNDQGQRRGLLDLQSGGGGRAGGVIGNDK